MMRYILFSLFFVVCVFCQNSIGAQNNQNGTIVFEAYSISVDLRPLDINELTIFFDETAEQDSNNVAAIENLNRWNIFHKVDKDIGYRIYFEFYADTEGKWQFDFVYDAGIVSGVLIDQKEVFFSDMDKYIDIQKPMVKTVALKHGWHKFEFLALENCCGSPITIRVKKPDMKEFKVISDKTLQLRSITQ
ncbi:MAG: hypothetical protein WC770_05140 [Phycisphaerae bacterium]